MIADEKSFLEKLHKKKLNFLQTLNIHNQLHLKARIPDQILGLVIDFVGLRGLSICFEFSARFHFETRKNFYEIWTCWQNVVTFSAKILSKNLKYKLDNTCVLPKSYNWGISYLDFVMKPNSGIFSAKFEIKNPQNHYVLCGIGLAGKMKNLDSKYFQRWESFHLILSHVPFYRLGCFCTCSN